MCLKTLFDGKGQKYKLDSDSVLYTPQTLNDDQKDQARQNIGATAIKVSLENGVLSIE